MKKHILLAVSVCAMAAALAQSDTAYCDTWYVSTAGDDTQNSGLDFDDAYLTIGKALSVAADEDSIYVAAGTYTTGGSSQADYFELDSTFLKIYGGFEGVVGESINDRDIYTNETIISGDLGPGVNTWHVMVFIDTDPGSRLDGFTIRDGIADGSARHSQGGGLQIDGADVNVVRCTIVANVAGAEDEVSGYGGGVSVELRAGEGDSTANIVSCVIADNTAYPAGGGVLCTSLATNFINTVIVGNHASGHDESTTFAKIGRGGGAFIPAVQNKDVRFDDCTIADNTATAFDSPGFDRDGAGGGIYVIGPSNADVDLLNTILWGNSDDSGDNPLEEQQIVPGAVNVTASYCCIEGLDEFDDPSANNIDDDPVFQGGGDYRLSNDSGVIGMGDDASLPDDLGDVNNNGNTSETLPYDIVDGPRERGDLDIGAFEHCPGDADDDGTVTFLDLLQVLTDWGTCVGCDSDFDGDDDVDLQDLLIVTSNWGCGIAIPISTSYFDVFIGDLESNTCLDEDDYDTYVDCMTNGSAAQKANCQCWWDHYVSDCNPSCGTPPCMGADPFGNPCGGH